MARVLKVQKGWETKAQVEVLALKQRLYGSDTVSCSISEKQVKIGDLSGEGEVGRDR